MAGKRIQPIQASQVRLGLALPKQQGDTHAPEAQEKGLNCPGGFQGQSGIRGAHQRDWTNSDLGDFQ